MIVAEPQVPQRDLRVRERHREGARSRAAIAILADQGERRIAIRCDTGREGDAHDRTRHETHAVAQRRDRVEHRPGGSRKRPSVEGDGIGGGAAATDELGAIRFPLHRAAETAFDPQDVEGQDGFLVGAALAPAEEKAGVLVGVLGFDEQLAECGMREIVLGLAEDDLGVARDLDFAHPVAVVRDRQPAHFDVVLR